MMDTKTNASMQTINEILSLLTQAGWTKQEALKLIESILIDYKKVNGHLPPVIEKETVEWNLKRGIVLQ